MTDLPYLSASVRRSLQTLTVLLPDETEVWLIESTYFGLFGPYGSAQTVALAISQIDHNDPASAETLSNGGERSIYIEYDCGEGVLVLVICENDVPLFYILVVDGSIVLSPKSKPEGLKKDGDRMAALRATRAKRLLQRPDPNETSDAASNRSGSGRKR